MVCKKFSLEECQIDFFRNSLFSGDIFHPIFHPVFFQFHHPPNILVQWHHAFAVMTVSLCPDNIAHSPITPPGYSASSEEGELYPRKMRLLVRLC